jgi:murein DD-endopeptidase MepM/ murein hydrolase activator NlpD
MYTNNPATDLSKNSAIVDGRSYQIRSWSNPGAEAPTPRPVAAANAEIPGRGSEFNVARPTAADPDRTHQGIDVSATTRAAGIRGEPVVATGAGHIDLSQNSGRGTGNSVTVGFGAGNNDQNFHLGRRDVSVGDWVNQGQQIGTVGSTGLPAGNDHLHYQTTRGGTRVDPQTVLSNPYPVRGAGNE